MEEDRDSEINSRTVNTEKPNYQPSKNLLKALWFRYCCSVPKSYLILCNPMDCSTPGFPVLHFLPEFAEIQVHWVSVAIQASGASDSKESACNAGGTGSIPGLGRSPGEANGNALQYSCWRSPWTEEPAGPWVAKGQTRLSDGHYSLLPQNDFLEYLNK